MCAEEGVGVVQNDHVEEVTPEKKKGTLTKIEQFSSFTMIHTQTVLNNDDVR